MGPRPTANHASQDSTVSMDPRSRVRRMLLQRQLPLRRRLVIATGGTMAWRTLPAPSVRRGLGAGQASKTHVLQICGRPCIPAFLATAPVSTDTKGRGCRRVFRVAPAHSSPREANTSVQSATRGAFQCPPVRPPPRRVLCVTLGRLRRCPASTNARIAPLGITRQRWEAPPVKRAGRVRIPTLEMPSARCVQPAPCRGLLQPLPRRCVWHARSGRGLLGTAPSATSAERVLTGTTHGPSFSMLSPLTLSWQTTLSTSNSRGMVAGSSCRNSGLSCT